MLRLLAYGGPAAAVRPASPVAAPGVASAPPAVQQQLDVLTLSLKKLQQEISAIVAAVGSPNVPPAAPPAPPPPP
ncbi:MAG: hypothetical protein JWM80_1020, partial [Cyanobacteria bacterium RYN_339]|nr:hypothetical protein [Cyanobacteria bacterium RYN_339]